MKISPRCVIALDVGGSSVKSGIVKSSSSVDFVQHTPLNSQASKNHILLVFIKIIKGYLDKIDPGELSGIAIGFPGPFDYENAICLIRNQSKYDHLFQVNIRNDFSADILIILFGIAGAREYFQEPLKEQLDIPVRPGKVKSAALFGAARSFSDLQ